MTNEPSSTSSQLKMTHFTVFCVCVLFCIVLLYMYILLCIYNAILYYCMLLLYGGIHKDGVYQPTQHKREYRNNRKEIIRTGNTIQLS